MNVYEMEGFLRGKRMPRDILVNESTAEYLVRKLNEATTVKAERDALADKCAKLDYNLGNALIGEQEVIRRSDALAVENAAQGAALSLISGCYGLSPHIQSMCAVETPATDAALAAIEARGVEKFADFLGKKYQCEKGATARAKALKHIVFLSCRFANELREAK